MTIATTPERLQVLQDRKDAASRKLGRTAAVHGIGSTEYRKAYAAWTRHDRIVSAALQELRAQAEADR